LNVLETRLPGVLLVEAKTFHDERGYFFESWSQERYRAHGVVQPFVQDNVSFSRRGTLRGLHYQNPSSQAKLVSVLQGTVFDVAVDLRTDLPTFGQWLGLELSGGDSRQLLIPQGFAHGFVVLSETAVFSYKCSDYYAPEYERSLRWDDPELGIEWPVIEPLLSVKDAHAPLLRDIPREHLFSGSFG
jgi:dTDP-4-dehydrorhamnose 3,5-epimerase